MGETKRERRRKCSDWITNYMEYTSNSEPSDVYRKWVAISTIAAALQRKCYANWGELTFYPNMYVVLVGPPAARKGTAIGPGKRLMEGLGIHMSAEATTREALIKCLAESNANTVSDDKEALTQHCSLTVLSPELTVFIGYNNHQLMADLTDWFDCANTWTYRTKGAGTDVIDGVFINLLGATTPSLLQSTLPLDAIGGGLTSRMILVYQANKARKVARPFLTDRQKIIKSSLAYDLSSIHMLNGQFTQSDCYVRAYSDWYESFEPSFSDHRFDGYFERKATHLSKLCMILSASRTDDMVITSEDFNRGLAILDEVENDMPKVFAGVGGNELGPVTERIIQDILLVDRIETSKLMRKYRSEVDGEQFARIIDALCNMKICQSVEKGGIRYLISNPDILEE